MTSTGKIVMAGAIDIHSHIAGANVNTARLLLPERIARASARAETPRSQSAGRRSRPAAAMPRWASPRWSSRRSRRTTRCMRISSSPTSRSSTRRRSRCSATTTSCSACCARRKARPRSATTSPGRWTTSRALGIKVINAGGAAAFKANVRAFSLDDVVPYYGVSSRAIVKALQHAVHELGVPHPLHVHCNNLGLAGQCRDRARHHRGGRRPAAASRASAVLRLRQGGRARLLVGGGAPRRGGECAPRTSPSTSGR